VWKIEKVAHRRQDGPQSQAQDKSVDGMAIRKVQLNETECLFHYEEEALAPFHEFGHHLFSQGTRALDLDSRHFLNPKTRQDVVHVRGESLIPPRCRGILTLEHMKLFQGFQLGHFFDNDPQMGTRWGWGVEGLLDKSSYDYHKNWGLFLVHDEFSRLLFDTNQRVFVDLTEEVDGRVVSLVTDSL
jgi:hypothetical protein